TSWPPTFSRWNEWRSTILPPRSGKICTTARSPSAAKPITSTVPTDCRSPPLTPPARLPPDRLPLDEVLHGEEPVAVARRVLEPLLGGRLLHLPLELPLDWLHVAGENLDHVVDDPPVVVRRDVADARGEAAVDVVVEARDPAVAAGLRPLTRPIAEDAVEHVERLAHLLRVRVRAEVPDAGPVPLAGKHDARVLVLDRDRDVRERLVVAQADVERRPV